MILILLAVFCFCGLAYAEEESPPVPWLTGSLLVPDGHVIPGGYYNVEPYLFSGPVTGAYDNKWHPKKKHNIWVNNPEIPIWIGISEKVDIYLLPQAFMSTSQGTTSAVFGDLFMGFDFQLYENTPKKWYPAVKFFIREEFPTGKYQKLNPGKNRTDIGGYGSFGTTFGLVFAKMFHLKNYHYYYTNFYVGYNPFTKVRVKGLNVYGGDPTTRGTVYPSSDLIVIWGSQFTLTKHWALALDIQSITSPSTRFKGKTSEPVGSGPMRQMSLAPAIEYNLNKNMGIIAGVWFSVAGRNDLQFINGVIAVNFYGQFRDCLRRK